MRKRTIFVLATAALAGCYDAAEGPPFRAQILDMVALDPATREPDYALVTREFRFLDDLDALSSPELRLVRGGTLLAQEVSGSVVIGRFEGAKEPRPRYIVQDGVAVARDYPTLAMLSAYYQFERVLADLERMTGFDIAEVASSIGQLEVYFEPRLRFETDEVSGEEISRFNAFYLPGRKQFGLAQRSRYETLPLAVNRQVVVHEFGHALFELTFFEDDVQDCEPDRIAEDPMSLDRFHVEYALSGFNEGFADFLSFAYTGSTNPLVALGFESLTERDFAEPDFRFEELSDSPFDEGEPGCAGVFYCIGTLFAHGLFRSMIELGYDPLDADDRGAYSRQVVGALSTTYAAMRELPEELIPSPRTRVSECGHRRTISLEYDGALSGAFLAAFVSQMPSETRAPLCDAFIASFGTDGFPESAREVCDES